MADESGKGQRTLDIREIEGEPFGDIMAALEDLDPDDSLRLISSFEPEPLYAVLGKRGFAYETDRVGDEWHVEVTHQ